jgi:pyrroloquinoline quinone biosynthesis protein B
MSLGEHFPGYIPPHRRENIPPGETLLGLTVQSESGRRLGYFPAVPAITPALLEELAAADVLLFDGTFWEEAELNRIRGSGPGARAIGHIPVSGSDGSLQLLSGIKTRKIYVHINNTNPMLDESGAQYQQVRAMGWEIGEDGWEFRL